MDSITKQILRKLIDKYEKSTNSQENTIRKIQIVLARELPEYNIENFTIKEDYNNVILKLKHDDIIDIKWLDGEEGNIVLKIWLNIESVSKAYNTLGRTPLPNKVKNCISILQNSIQNLQSVWAVKYINSKIQELEMKNKLLKSLPETESELKELLSVIKYASIPRNYILERVFSQELFKNTKKFGEKYRSKLISILKETHNDKLDGTESNNDILKLIGIEKYPEDFHFCGNLLAKNSFGITDFSSLYLGASIVSRNLENITLSINAKEIIFIENKANYIDFIDKRTPEQLLIFHGGMFSPSKKIFFQKIKEATELIPDIKIFHWGDIDWGGFSMLARLRRELFGNKIKPYLMGRPELKERYIEISDESYLKKLNDLLTVAELDDVKDVISYMIKNKVKLEQEALL